MARSKAAGSWPYSPGEYARRLLWWLVWATAWKLAWKKVPALRTGLLRLFGARIDGTIEAAGSTWIEMPWLLRMGDRSCLGPRVHVYNLGPVSIGRRVTVSQDAYLCAGTHDHRDPDFPLVRSRISIGHGAWIAAGAFVGPDVTVGDRAVVAARAVVVRDVEPDAIVGGNPAKRIGTRPTDAAPRGSAPPR